MGRLRHAFSFCLHKMTSQKPVSYGSVKELAKEPITIIPPRYVQINQEPANLSDGTTIPVVDMKRLLMGERLDFELQQLDSVCKKWGIFQLVNHGVSSTLMEQLKYEVEEFYKLPEEEKMRYKLKEGEVEGYGQTILHSKSDKVDWADRFYMITNPINRRKSHLFPELPSTLRDTLELYILALQKLAMSLFRLMAKALKMDEREMEEMFEDGMQSVRMTYYPPCPQPEKVVGLTPHSDATGITFLLQINGVEGLQVKRNGLWIPVKFLPDAFVVNVGDIMEILSNGIYNSIEHRATVNKMRERISVAMFFNPKFQSEVGPAISLITPKNPPLFKRVGMEKYFKDFFSRKLSGKLFLEELRIKNGEGCDLSN